MLDYNKHFVKSYQHAIETMHTEEKVALLYEKAISCMQRVKEALERDAQKEKYEQLERVSKIINGLRESIDIQAINQDIANQLNQYYYSLDCLVVSLQSSSDMEACNRVITNLRVLHEAWEQKIASYEQEQTTHWINLKDLRRLV